MTAPAQIHIGKVLVSLWNPKLTARDIAHMQRRLHHIRRFCGDGWTVAHHLDACGIIAGELGYTNRVQFWSRRHDLHEGALGDVLSPIISSTDAFSDAFSLLQRIWDVEIRRVLGFEPPDRMEIAQVDEVDLIARQLEMYCIGLSDSTDGIPDCIARVFDREMMAHREGRE